MTEQEKREKVIKGMELCNENNLGFQCPSCYCYPLQKSDRCLFKLHEDALALLKEYDDALKLMVYQYCTMKPLTVHDEVFHNKFMSAGEAAFRLLGLENGQSTDGVWERWFPNG